MAKPKLGVASNGDPLHYSVGAVIEKDGKYLLIDRATWPLCMAGPAGHIDEGETHLEAIRREVAEETGLTVVSETLLLEHEFLKSNPCNKGVGSHYWYLYSCETEGEIFQEETREAKSLTWLRPEEIAALPNLENVWEYCFKRIGVL